MLDLEKELSVFLHAVLMGILALAFYFCFEALRHLFPHKRWMIHIEDICYWCIVSVYLFVQLYYTNNGKIRWFGALGIVIGAGILWKTVLLFQKVAEKIRAFFRKKFYKKS